MNLKQSTLFLALVASIPFLSAKVPPVIAEGFSSIEIESRSESFDQPSEVNRAVTDTPIEVKQPTSTSEDLIEDLFDKSSSEELENSAIFGSGGVRASFRQCPGENFSIEAIAPDSKEAIITSQYPSFSFQFSQSTSRPVFFSITNQDITEPLLDTKLKSPHSGLVEIHTPTSVQLEADTYYVATLMVVCSEQRPSLNYYVRYPFLYDPSSE